MATAHPELGWLHDHPDLPIPVVKTPDCFDIAVVGRAAGRGAYCYGAGEPVTLPTLAASSDTKVMPTLGRADVGLAESVGQGRCFLESIAYQ